MIEAKKTIPSDKSLSEAKTQVRSYANLLKAEYSVIASQEGIWIMSQKDDYSESIFTASWRELDNPDTFHGLGNLIGRR